MGITHIMHECVLPDGYTVAMLQKNMEKAGIDRLEIRRLDESVVAVLERPIKLPDPEEEE